MSELLAVKEYGIASRIEKEKIPEGKELEKFLADIKNYIRIMELEAVEFHMKNRDESHLTYYETLDFFRNSERLQNTKYILQYQIKFTEELPLEEKAAKLPENPFLQFRGFVLFMIKQLQEADVIESIMREYKELGLLTDKTKWYYKGIVKRAYDEMIMTAADANKAIPEDYRKLFTALKKHSLFWFSIRRENVQRVRKSDMYIYRLSRILSSRIDDGG